MIPGIDVSHYQGEIDWQKVKASGMEFAFIKATESVFVDPFFTRNRDGATAAGLKWAPYHFVRPGSVLAQISLVSELFVKGQFKIPRLALDVEEDSIPLDQVQLFVNAFPEAVLYTDRYWIEQHVESAPEKNPPPLYSTPLWIAEYGLSFPKFFPWANWTFWQNGSGRVTGISVPVDLDWFNGTLEELEAFWAPAA